MSNGLFHYEPKGDHLTIFKGKKKLHTPNGNVVITQTTELADHLVTLLEQDTDHTSCATSLCYHYTYCDLIAQYDLATVRNDLKMCISDNLYEDPLLLFREQDLTPDTVTEEQYNALHAKVAKDFGNLTGTLNMHQMVAIIVLYVSFDSLALSWRIINDIIDGNVSREQFVSDLHAFCQSEELEYPDDIINIIDAFTTYYAL